MQLFWKFGEKNSQKSKNFVIFPQTWNWWRVNLFWFCQSLKYEVFMWKNKYEKKRAIILKVRGKKLKKIQGFREFSPKVELGENQFILILPIINVWSFLGKIRVWKKTCNYLIRVWRQTCNYSESQGGKTPKNPKISWVFSKSEISLAWARIHLFWFC